ncbi:MAG TPA: 3-deoxy-manno-octulosonate cytidylyltransferase [Pseudomonadaceae bacterium]|nr:3-deoxy-manno-octulosonate cytidylyltransferase [Pseudomonadaceae bacterium]
MSDQPFIVVIPARYQSTRLPGKPLLDIGGKPMLLHVVERARASQATAVYVATDDPRIHAVCEQYEVPVCLTAAEHSTGTDRIEEVTRQLALAANAIVVNVQGDEPLIPPQVINQVATNLAARPEAGICTLYAPLYDADEFQSPHAVKLVCDEQGRVLYFSRAPIPWPRDAETSVPMQAKRHIGLYAYRVEVLQQFVQWPVGALEQVEKLEQLRAMEQGILIHAAQACADMPPGVDTPADLEAVRGLLRGVDV